MSVTELIERELSVLDRELDFEVQESEYRTVNKRPLPRNDDEVVQNIRFDWQLSTRPGDFDWGENPAFKSMKAFLSLDVEDLVENGDIDQSDDALLKAFYGSKKRGKSVDNFEILVAKLYRKEKPKEERVDYTLYILIRVSWS